MLHEPLEDEYIYEVSLYNKLVRPFVKEKHSHEDLNYSWADTQLHYVVGAD